MINFTSQEKGVLLFLALTIVLGSSLHYAFKRYPELHDFVNLLEGDRLYPKVDLNTASIEELTRVSYIGQYTAENIVRHRKDNGLFTSVEQIKAVKGIRGKNYDLFFRYLEVSKP